MTDHRLRDDVFCTRIKFAFHAFKLMLWRIVRVECHPAAELTGIFTVDVFHELNGCHRVAVKADAFRRQFREALAAIARDRQQVLGAHIGGCRENLIEAFAGVEGVEVNDQLLRLHGQVKFRNHLRGLKAEHAHRVVCDTGHIARFNDFGVLVGKSFQILF